MTTTSQTAPVLSFQSKPASNQQRMIYEQVTEHARTLGIAAPTVLIAYVDGTPKEILKSRGEYNYNTQLGEVFRQTHELYVNPRLIKKVQQRIKKDPKYYNYRHDKYYKINKGKFTLPHVIAHEMIHLAFPELEHGNRFEDYYVDSLLEGHMVFYRHKQVKMIITQVTKPKEEDPAIDAEIAIWRARRKRHETVIKRSTTWIKKIDRKIKRLEKKKQK